MRGGLSRGAGLPGPMAARRGPPSRVGHGATARVGWYRSMARPLVSGPLLGAARGWEIESVRDIAWLWGFVDRSQEAPIWLI